MELSAAEVRVLGCLIEKGATTPDQYPLSTNALVGACNQKSNRDPVVAYTEAEVVAAMLLIRQEGLARTNASGRSDKHRHILPDALGLDLDQLAVLAVILLRGPQSPGELKTRTERYPTSQGVGFESLDDIEAVLAQLAEGQDPFVANVGRASGQSQDRWAHLLGDDDDAEIAADDLPARTDQFASTTDMAPTAAPANAAGSTLEQRVESIERRLARLETALGVTDSDTDDADDSDGGD